MVMLAGTVVEAASSTASFRARVDEELLVFLEERRLEVASFAPDALLLVDELLRLVRAGGKRLRPVFCYWGYRAGGGTDGSAIVRAGAAIELLHTFAIVHDDVIDGSLLRRGEPTTAAALASAGSAPRGAATASAILVGDVAHALADRLFRHSGFPAPLVAAASVHLDRMRLEVACGELLDLAWARGRADGFDEARARTLASLKGGSYTVTGPLLIGATFARASGEVLGALEAFGGAVGEAFQLRDDVLGTFGDPVRTGKDRDTDIRGRKLTALVAKAHRRGSAAERRILDGWLGAPEMTVRDVQAVTDAIRTSGALAETLELIGSLVASARRTLATAPIPREAAAVLGDLADQAGRRDA